MRAVVACMVTAGCVQWTVPEMQQRRVPLAAPAIALRTDQLPGTGTLLADGAFRFQIDLAHVCRRSELVKERVVTVESKEFSRPGQASLIAGGAAIALGAVLAATDTADPKSSTGPSLIVVGLPFVGVPLYYRYATGGSRREKMVQEKDVPSSAIDVPCEGFSPAQVLGELQVATPWGQTLRAPIGSDGAVQIALDWATTGLDPYDPQLAQRLAASWNVRSTRTGLAMDWVPGVADRDTELRLVQVASAARTGEPPELAVVALNPDGGSLVAGQSNTIRLTIENRGGGLARNLRAKVRSSHAAIDNRDLSFGDLGAKETRTRSIDIDLPGDEKATAITVVAELALDQHKPPPSHTAQLAVTPRLCPPEKLTRADYLKKREKLQKMVQDGLLKEAEFQRYDAILVGCQR
ncbi:MAG: hypothetical protein KF773_11200 [Deltaproteobacteria bacterium]|nr:hypothetical protein [Deltaproteobacteria bacterium]